MNRRHFLKLTGLTTLSSLVACERVEQPKLIGVAPPTPNCDALRWGDITGTPAEQIDLQAAFDAKCSVERTTITEIME